MSDLELFKSSRSLISVLRQWKYLNRWCSKIPDWLIGIDPNRAHPEIREEILRYQREAVDVLYTWAQTPRTIAAPTSLVPVGPNAEPVRPAADAPLAKWHEYHCVWLPSSNGR
jgi:P22_AR N-terminal domain